MTEVETLHAELEYVEERLQQAKHRETVKRLRASFSVLLEDDSLPIARIVAVSGIVSVGTFAKELERQIQHHRANPELR